MNKNLQIDPSMLDEEWLQQPLLFDQAVTEAADCQKTVDEAKDERDDLKIKLEWLLADRANYLRSAWNKEGFTKPPGNEPVAEWVAKRPEIEALKAELQEKQKEITEAMHRLNIANGTVKSLEVKKAALENLCKLHGMNYFSIPNPNHMLDGGKRVLQAIENRVEEKSCECINKLNENKKARKTKEEVLDKIKNPDTREEARKRIEAEEHRTGDEEGETSSTIETPKPRARRRRK